MAQTFSFPNYGLFNATYYLQRNPDVATSWTGTPLQHYISYGALEGRAPTAWFNADFYRQAYSDLNNMNALQLFNHYCNYGYNEGRTPMLNFSNFNGARYLLDNPDLVGIYTAANAISHYVQYGEYEGRVAYADNGVVIQPVVNLGDTYTLTTNIDSFLGTSLNDTFNASVGAVGAVVTNTLQNFDSLDGAGGTDKLNVNLQSTGAGLVVAPVALSNIEQINVAASGTNDLELSLLNAGQAQQVSNVGSSVGLTLSGLAASATALEVQNTAQATTFAYVNTTGAQTSSLNVSNATGAITVNGIETINLTSSGNTGAANAITLNDNALTTLNIAGANAITVNGLGATTTNVNGASMTGGLTTTLAYAGATVALAGSLTGGAGNDSLTGSAGNDIITGNAGNDTITSAAGVDNLSGGLGDDLFVMAANLTAEDTIDGGVGTNTISTTSQVATGYVRPATATITNIQGLTLSDALAGAGGTTLTMTDLSSGINTLTLAAGSSANAATVVGAAGTASINVSGGTLGAQLTVNDTGTATTDVLNLSNTRATAATNVLNGQNLVIGGYETLNIAVGSGNGNQTLGTIALTADTGGTTAVNFTGANNIQTGVITANVINASGLTGTAGLTVTGATVGATNITGSANADTIISTLATATTVLAGAGNDNVTGGNAADSIDGQAGNDSINGGAGNDTIRGGDGDDVITATTSGIVSIDGGAGNDTVLVGATLNSTDTIDGGAGVNTLSFSQEILGAYAGATNFSTLRMASGAANMNQNVALFTGTTFNKVETTANQTYGISGLADGTAIAAEAATTAAITATHATDTASNTLTVEGNTAGNHTISALTANTTNTLSVVANDLIAGNTLTITALDAIQATNINISGVQNTSITFNTNGAAGGTGQTAHNVAVDATTATGTVVFDATTAQANQSVTLSGSLTAANTLTGGAGNDVITGGAGADSLLGLAGADTINSGAGNDTVTGGADADVINVGAGTDRLVYSGNTDTQTGVLATGAVLTGDIVTGMGTGDSISLAGLGNLVLGDGAITVSTTFATATANLATIVTGSYDALTHVFTSGAASATNNDYLVQYNGGASTTTVNSFVMVDIVGTVTAASLNEIITLTVA